MTEDGPAPRSGSGVDLSRRMDRLEAKHDELASDVTTLKRIVDKIEVTQEHQAELTHLRFSALDTSTAAISQKLDAFMVRFDSILTGEVQLPRGQELMADWKSWRESVEAALEDPSRSPAGRALAERQLRSEETHKALFAKLEEVTDESTKSRTWIAAATAVIAVFVLVAQIIGPLLGRLLFS